ncbi:Tetrahydromethanopterin S-methyltransferase subunit B [Methanohalobium evestigatum Z-7303]|uniref:Tetrahydromethanopterin S-methyltransferase subunit B n=1 Tax=Methanohalobium evestigatum (strain ATCC BAA-1072 / DSM 3721 / NBRC 107634 / OCM 161 / Z-7303) TaxID=644295 RepID=D7EBK6_METEZ|nr:tetrahydromethanopterin S-methyltransferase subunit B [Methanohalobium evestigatum]ADI74848.1 Tetrahydromethanopterin S-methyltransferase subunit B [Methanohalobium evestigatum Z-7303]
MTTVHVAPEVNLVMDPMSGLVATEREDIISYSMDPILEQLDELDKVADDMVNSLSPNMPLLNSNPGRERTSYYAGIASNAFYGIIVGLIFATIIIIALYAMGQFGGGL